MISMFVIDFPGLPGWTNLFNILDEKDGGDSELLVYSMTLINKVGSVLLTPT